ncbi:MAG: sulfatase [Planctomycetota bacterium]
MTDSPPSRGLAPLWIGLGVLLAALGLAADALGLTAIGGGQGLGLRQLGVLLIGVTLIARQAWRDAARPAPASCLWVMAWLGLLCGFADVAAVWINRHGLGELVHKPAEYLWIMPAAYLALFLTAGLLVALAVRVLPGLVTLPVVVLGPAIFVFWSPTLQFGMLDEIATVVLAVGAATALARVAADRPESFVRFCRTTALGMLAATVAFAAGVAYTERATERAALAALPAAPRAAPNVLLVVLDTLRADHFGSYGYARDTTPRIDQLAAEGVLFEEHWSTAPWTLTSHVSLFTGRYPHETSADWKTPLDDALPTLAEVLSANGYATAGFVGNLFYCGAENGLDRGFSRYDDYLLKWGTLLTTPSLGFQLFGRLVAGPAFVVLRNSAAEINARCLDWIDRREDPERPFFAFLNYFDAHAMYLPPAGYETKYGAPDRELMMRFHSRGWTWSAWDTDQQQAFVDAYDACLRYVDDELAKLLDGLRDRGLLDNTLVIVTSDHGELFGEHNMKEHATSLYLPLLHVPLILWWPGKVPAGRRVDAEVSLVDVPATLLDLVALARPEGMPGTSLQPLWASQPTPIGRSPLVSAVSQGIRIAPALPAAKGDMRSLVESGLHFIVNGDGSEELYDVRADRGQERNLIETRADDAARLRAALERAWR